MTPPLTRPEWFWVKWNTLKFVSEKKICFCFVLLSQIRKCLLQRNQKMINYNFLNFAFLIDIIDNIITYSPYYVTKTPTNESAEYWSRETDRNHVTSILHWSFGDVILTIRTLCNNIINYIYSKCKIRIK